MIIVTLNLNTYKEMQILSSFYQQSNWGTEKLSIFPKLTQLGNVKPGFISGSLVAEPMFLKITVWWKGKVLVFEVLQI